SFWLFIYYIFIYLVKQRKDKMKLPGYSVNHQLISGFSNQRGTNKQFSNFNTKLKANITLPKSQYIKPKPKSSTHSGFLKSLLITIGIFVADAVIDFFLPEFAPAIESLEYDELAASIQGIRKIKQLKILDTGIKSTKSVIIWNLGTSLFTKQKFNMSSFLLNTMLFETPLIGDILSYKKLVSNQYRLLIFKDLEILYRETNSNFNSSLKDYLQKNWKNIDDILNTNTKKSFSTQSELFSKILSDFADGKYRDNWLEYFAPSPSFLDKLSIKIKGQTTTNYLNRWNPIREIFFNHSEQVYELSFSNFLKLVDYIAMRIDPAYAIRLFMKKFFYEIFFKVKNLLKDEEKELDKLSALNKLNKLAKERKLAKLQKLRNKNYADLLMNDNFILFSASEWIYGIRLVPRESSEIFSYLKTLKNSASELVISNPSEIMLYKDAIIDIFVYFIPSTTSSTKNPEGKQTLFITGLSILNDIWPWLNSPSKGSYYYYKIMWGYNIRKEWKELSKITRHFAIHSLEIFKEMRWVGLDYVFLGGMDNQGFVKQFKHSLKQMDNSTYWKYAITQSMLKGLGFKIFANPIADLWKYKITDGRFLNSVNRSLRRKTRYNITKRNRKSTGKGIKWK
ncbi:MAG: hypothetical protein ACRCW6_01070, partial [Mycoplasmoidaceae bacterium]